MKIKRFFAPDIRQAIRLVREDLGSDAVILSNTRVNGGVEIVAAVDYDDSLLGLTEAPPGHEALPQERGPAVAAASGGAPSADERGAAASAGTRRSENVWSQEPTLVEMRSELSLLRRMLESQLSSLAWGSFARHEPQRVELIQRLLSFGLTAPECRMLAESLPAEGDADKLWHRALALLANRLPVYPHDVLNDGGIVALVGPTGVGKTTTAAKLAARYALRHGNRQVALVTIDNHRVGAYEQLRIYGRILDIPVKVAGSREELRKVLGDLCDRRLVLIDTAGMGQHDCALASQVQLLDLPEFDKRTLLLLAAPTRLSGLEDVTAAFREFGPDGCVITKVDEATCLGGVLSIAMRHQLPLAYMSDGQRVPEDLHGARPHSLVAKGVELMNRAGATISEDLIALTFGKEVANACF